jgi:hypothetical protein
MRFELAFYTLRYLQIKIHRETNNIDNLKKNPKYCFKKTRIKKNREK